MKYLWGQIAKYSLVSLKLHYQGDTLHVKHTTLLLSGDASFFHRVFNLP